MSLMSVMVSRTLHYHELNILICYGACVCTHASRLKCFWILLIYLGFLSLLFIHFQLIVCTAALATEASAKVIDGKSVAKQIREEITAEVSRMKEAIGVIPGLAVILVGDRKDSATYVRNKKKACESAGINSFEVHLPENSTEQEVLDNISRFNDDPLVHGILIQLPLPPVCF